MFRMIDSVGKTGIFTCFPSMETSSMRARGATGFNSRISGCETAIPFCVAKRKDPSVARAAESLCSMLHCLFRSPSSVPNTMQDTKPERRSGIRQGGSSVTLFVRKNHHFLIPILSFPGK